MNGKTKKWKGKQEWRRKFLKGRNKEYHASAKGGDRLISTVQGGRIKSKQLQNYQ